MIFSNIEIKGVEFNLMAELLYKMSAEDCEKKIEEIRNLKDGWAGEHSYSFSKELIDKCEELVKGLEVKPFIFPCLNGGIQFEYEKRNKDYLEFVIFRNRIKFFMCAKDGSNMRDGFVENDDVMKKMNEMINNFVHE